jgi:polysaccharide export outer membrane protein
LRHFTHLSGPVLAALVTAGCGTTGPYVWASDLKSAEVGSADYAIVTGDVISVKVFNQDAMSTHAKVRSDGKIAMPFLGDILVTGKSPAALAKELETGLKAFINAPNVTVTVDEFQPTTVTVIGEVGKPGAVAVERNSGVLEALAGAGGLTENASRDDIYVLRQTPVARRIRFTYDSLVLYPPVQTFRLRPGDIIVVE